MTKTTAANVVSFETIEAVPYAVWIDRQEPHLYYHTEPVVFTYKDYKDLLTRCGCNWDGSKELTIPGNRDEKPGHLKTLLEKDIQSLDAYDFRLGCLGINPDAVEDHWTIINHGHRCRAIWRRFQDNPNGSVTISIQFTDALAAGHDRTQSQWQVKDALITKLSRDYEPDAAKRLAKFGDEGGKALRCRLQGLAIGGGGQNAHTYAGSKVGTDNESSLLDFCPVHIALWNCFTTRTKTGSTLETLLSTKEFYKDSSKLAKYRKDYAPLAMLDTFPEIVEPLANGEKEITEKHSLILNRFEEHYTKLASALDAVYDDLKPEERYKVWLTIWESLEANRIPNSVDLMKSKNRPYPNGLPTIAQKYSEQMEEILEKILENQKK